MNIYITNSIILLVTIFSLFQSHESDNKFFGKIVVEWLEHKGPDRDVKLLGEFGYIDPDGKIWKVPAGAVVNGASIPEVLWSVIGSPFVGDYRKASVIHDYFCDRKNENSKSVHRMFYYACLAGGVSKSKAKTMFAAVYWGGPQWKIVITTGLEKEDPIVVELDPREIEKELFNTFRKEIEKSDPSLEEIERMVDEKTKGGN